MEPTEGTRKLIAYFVNTVAGQSLTGDSGKLGIIHKFYFPNKTGNPIIFDQLVGRRGYVCVTSHSFFLTGYIHLRF